MAAMFNFVRSVGHRTTKFVGHRTAEFDFQGEKCHVVFETEAFAQGSCRYAHKGAVKNNQGKVKGAVVMKVFKDKVAKEASDWTCDMATSVVASKLAEVFNEKYPTNRPITFVNTMMVPVESRGGTRFMGVYTRVKKNPREGRGVAKGEYVAMEPWIDGKFDKFNSNSGWDSAEHQLMPAFSHFTWLASEGNLLVCDLQGVRTDDAYVLTDPAIHTNADGGMFGGTDLVIQGMAMFWLNHRCSSICCKWRRPKGPPGLGSLPKMSRGSTFLCQVGKPSPQQQRQLKAALTMPRLQEMDSGADRKTTSADVLWFLLVRLNDGMQREAKPPVALSKPSNLAGFYLALSRWELNVASKWQADDWKEDRKVWVEMIMSPECSTKHAALCLAKVEGSLKVEAQTASFLLERPHWTQALKALIEA